MSSLQNRRCIDDSLAANISACDPVLLSNSFFLVSSRHVTYIYVLEAENAQGYTTQEGASIIVSDAIFDID